MSKNKAKFLHGSPTTEDLESKLSNLYQLDLLCVCAAKRKSSAKQNEWTKTRFLGVLLCIISIQCDWSYARQDLAFLNHIYILCGTTMQAALSNKVCVPFDGPL